MAEAVTRSGAMISTNRGRIVHVSLLPAGQE
jgi:hypothetical protein